METMEEYKVVRILNEEPEFFEMEENNFSVDFFILCEEGKLLFGKNVFDLQICGMSLVNWVVRVCGKQPKILRVQKDADVLEIIRPYASEDTEYTVVFYADTPLVSKNHLNDLLGFVDRKRMNVCKLKRGFVFRNDFIKENSEIYPIDEYDFASNDLFVVDSSESFEVAKNVLTKKVINYHKKNGVFFENENSVVIDANTEIGECSRILSGASIVCGTKIGKNSEIARNASVVGSIIGRFSRVGTGSYIEKSIVKDNARIQENVVIKNSVIGTGVSIDTLSSVFSSSIRDGVIVKNNVQIEESKVCENAVIQGYCKILGINEKTIIGAGSEIGVNTKIFDRVIPKDTQIDGLLEICDRVVR